MQDSICTCSRRRTIGDDTLEDTSALNTADDVPKQPPRDKLVVQKGGDKKSAAAAKASSSEIVEKEESTIRVVSGKKDPKDSDSSRSEPQLDADNEVSSGAFIHIYCINTHVPVFFGLDLMCSVGCGRDARSRCEGCICADSSLHGWHSRWTAF